MTEIKKPHVLYIYPGLVPPPLDHKRNKHFFLSEVSSGDILLPLWWKDKAESEKRLNLAPGASFVSGQFTYHFLYTYRYPSFLRSLMRFFFYVFKGLSLGWSSRKFDAVVTYGTNATGIAAAIVSRLLRTKLIVEIPGTPSKAYVLDDSTLSFGLRLRKRLADLCLRAVLSCADHIRLLYPTQLSGYPYADAVPSTVYHEFVPVKLIPESDLDERFIYFLGSPWHLKGVDVLIKAFRSLERDFPHVRLKIVGHCPDQTPFLALAGDSKQIEFSPGVPHATAMELMSRCCLFVLPSRTEAMGCVMLEAMAARKPVVASAVDGIPFYLKDGENGLLFPSGDVSTLAEKLRRILTDPQFAATLGSRGRHIVATQYSEKEYARHFGRMLQETLSR